MHVEEKVRKNGHKKGLRFHSRNRGGGSVSVLAGIAAAMILFVGAVIILASAIYEMASLEKNIKM